MPTTLAAENELRCQFSAEQRVDSATGRILGATVAKAGVRALGKFVFLDAQGERTLDPEKAARKVPVFTDEETLKTLMTAAVKEGGRVKCREDHDDSVGARAGLAETFTRDGDRVTVDLSIFEAYRNRAIFLETAQKTPEAIGLSMDIDPTYEIRGDRAFMRVRQLFAVDIVDAGAVTPDGLLMNREAVDNLEEVSRNSNTNPESRTTMAEPTLGELMTAVTKMTDGYAALSQQVLKHGELLAKLSAAPVVDADKDGMKATITDLSGKLSALTSQIGAMKKERALLGLTVTSAERAKLAAENDPAKFDEIAAGAKNYLQLVDEHVASTKCSRVEAHAKMQREHPEHYRLHLSSKGVTKAA
jgi:hypothetical protein